jgi:thiol-disulfide isomerase/thioredoxin
MSGRQSDRRLVTRAEGWPFTKPLESPRAAVTFPRADPKRMERGPAVEMGETLTTTRRDVLFGSALGLASAAGMGRSAGTERYPPPLSTPHAQFVVLEPRVDVGGIMLRGLNGRTRTLGSFKGKPVLLNFWASWCPPCRRELPILHRLQGQAGQADFAVVPVSLDREPAVAASYLRRLSLPGFTSFIDRDGTVASGPNSKTATPFPLYGMPMSYVIDASGRSAGYLVGEADWGSPQALAVLRFYARF